MYSNDDITIFAADIFRTINAFGTVKTVPYGKMAGILRADSIRPYDIFVDIAAGM